VPGGSHQTAPTSRLSAVGARDEASHQEAIPPSRMEVSENVVPSVSCRMMHAGRVRWHTEISCGSSGWAWGIGAFICTLLLSGMLVMRWAPDKPEGALRATKRTGETNL
jgi:predicted cobalt transporter CbtA